MSTPRALIALALKLSGAYGQGQVAPAEDVADAQAMLVQMGSQWMRKRWLVPHLLDTAVPLVPGKQLYTLGMPGGDIALPRPDRIETAFLRVNPASLQPVDWPIGIIDNREDWNAVSSKFVRGVPSHLFYNPSFPLSNLVLWPIPSASNYQLHLGTKDFPAFSTLDADTNLPPEYDAALTYHLAVRLRPYYQLGSDPVLTALALDALNLIRNANAAIPHLRMPAGLPGMRSSGGWLVGGTPGAQTGFQIGISTLAAETEPAGPYPNQDKLI